MASAVCQLCTRCANCRWTNEHYQACEVVYTAVSASIVMHHEKEAHAPLALDIARRGNEIQVKRLFRDIVEPQVDPTAAAILEQWLAQGKLEVDNLPNEIPRLWKS